MALFGQVLYYLCIEFKHFVERSLQIHQLHVTDCITICTVDTCNTKNVVIDTIEVSRYQTVSIVCVTYCIAPIRTYVSVLEIAHKIVTGYFYHKCTQNCQIMSVQQMVVQHCFDPSICI